MDSNNTAQATASTTDLDLAVGVLHTIFSILGRILLASLAGAISVGAGALTGNLCSYIRHRVKSGEDKFGDWIPLWVALSILNGGAFVVVGSLLCYIHDAQEEAGEPTMSLVGSLGLLLLAEFAITVVSGVGILGYIAIERAVQRPSKESGRLQAGDEWDEGCDEESVGSVKERW